MALSDDQLLTLAAWFSDKGVSSLCPSCGTNQWLTPDMIVAAQYEGGNLSFVNPVVPMVRLVCKNCMFIRLYAAVPIGLTE